MQKFLSTPLWSLLLLIAGIGWNASEAQAQAITFSYVFDGQVLTGTSSQAGATANNATYGAGLGTKTFFAGNPGDAIAGDGFASGTPLNPANNDYFGFSFTAGPCFAVTLTSLSFDARRSGTGPSNLEIRSSADGFTTTLFAGTLTSTNFESKSGTLANLVIAGGQTVEFRLYGYNASGGTGTLRVDNVKYNGTIAASVPTAFTVTGGGAICPPVGTPVGLSGSQTNVNYQLSLNGSPVGAPLTGTGNALNFGDQTGLGTYTVVATNTNGCTTNQTGSVTITQSGNCGGGGCTITLSSTQVNVLCNGASTGSIDLTASGGIAPYTYAWTGGATTEDRSNLVAGTYSVTVTDAAACTKTLSATITQSTAIVLTETHINVLCNGASTGSIDLTVSGGASPYTYSWTGGVSTQDRSGLAIGTYTVTVTDANTCTKTTSVTITQPAALSLSSTAVIPSNCFVADGSIDLSVSGGVAAYTYDWSNDGPDVPDNDPQDLLNLVEGAYTVTVTDANGCSATHAKTLDYIDIVNPSITCPGNTSVAADNNCSSPIGAYVPTSLSDNCTANPTVVQSPVSSTIVNLANPSRLVTLTATDEAGNTKTCNFTVSLVDVTKPNISCPVNAIVMADAACSGTVGSWNAISANDNCGGSPSVTQSPAASTPMFGHNDFRMITLTATDASSNTSTCTFTVTLKDQTKPNISCPANVTINANANCNSAIGAYNPSALNDNCTANPTVVQSPLPSTLLSGHNSSVIVTLTATDAAANTQSCTFTVTLKDVTPPSIVCKNFVAFLDANGNATINPTDVFQAGSDNCGVVNLVSVVANTFACNNIGANLVILTANDGNGNSATCSATVVVRDVTPPVAKCKDITANLGVNGIVTILPSMVNNGTTDNCSFSLLVTPGSFNCANIGINTVTLRATDAGGNTATCTANVSVRDLIAPNAKCKNPTIFVNDAGQATLTPAQVNNGSTDACGIATMSINETQFNCSNIPGSSWPVTLSLTDVNGNASSCLSNVTVKDAIAPTAVCENVTVSLNVYGIATVYADQLAFNSFDNCSVWSYLPVAKVYTASNLGPNNLPIIVKDWSGNAATCISVVTVLPYGGNRPSGNGRNEQKGLLTDAAFNVYPNPTTGDVTLAFNLYTEQPLKIRVFDLQGRMLLSRETLGQEGDNLLPLRLEGFAAGLYLLDFQTEGFKVQKRLMVQE